MISWSFCWQSCWATTRSEVDSACRRPICASSANTTTAPNRMEVAIKISSRETPDRPGKPDRTGLLRTESLRTGSLRTNRHRTGSRRTATGMKFTPVLETAVSDFPESPLPFWPGLKLGRAMSRRARPGHLSPHGIGNSNRNGNFDGSQDSSQINIDLEIPFSIQPDRRIGRPSIRIEDDRCRPVRVLTGDCFSRRWFVGGCQ
jgi:hypothetical protein